jgi:hypothetical protein
LEVEGAPFAAAADERRAPGANRDLDAAGQQA